MKMAKETLKAFRTDFKTAVAELEKKYGVVVDIGNILYSENSFTTKMTVTNGTSAEDAEKAAFDANVWAVAHYGLNASDYGREFATPRGVFKLVGIKTKSRKNPFVVRDVNGKQYVCAPDFLGLKDTFLDGFKVKTENGKTVTL